MSNGTHNSTSNPKRRILVVDDNPDCASSLAILLELSGYETVTAGDGVEAVEKAQSFTPDAVLLDLGLPRLSGQEVCRAIRRNQADRRPVVIALSGWGQDHDRQSTTDAGFDAHMVKPPDFDKLLSLLDSLWHAHAHVSSAERANLGV